MVVVDTNVLAYLLIEGDRTADAQALYARDPDWRSEGFVLVEFSNILATCLRGRRLDRVAAKALLADADRVLSGTVNVHHPQALEIAAEFGVSAYDARFLGAARGLGKKLVTEDAKLRRSAPALTLSLAQALTGTSPR
jgi:predicted nucleic acid-binding protein